MEQGDTGEKKKKYTLSSLDSDKCLLRQLNPVYPFFLLSLVALSYFYLPRRDGTNVITRVGIKGVGIEVVKK